MSNEDREKQALAWLERLREAAAGKQSLVEYCRRHGLRPGEAYQWKRNLRSSRAMAGGQGQWIDRGSEDGAAGICARAHCAGDRARCRRHCICNCIWRTAVEPSFC